MFWLGTHTILGGRNSSCFPVPFSMICRHFSAKCYINRFYHHSCIFMLRLKAQVCTQCNESCKILLKKRERCWSNQGFVNVNEEFFRVAFLEFINVLVFHTQLVHTKKHTHTAKHINLEKRNYLKLKHIHGLYGNLSSCICFLPFLFFGLNLPISISFACKCSQVAILFSNIVSLVRLLLFIWYISHVICFSILLIFVLYCLSFSCCCVLVTFDRVNG